MSRYGYPIRLFLFCLCLFWFQSSPLQAQRASTGLNGTISDASGAIIPNDPITGFNIF